MFDRVLRRVATFGWHNFDEIEPCSTVEVEELEEQYGHRFPPPYRDFLLTMGKSAGKELLTEYNVFYQDIRRNQTKFSDVFREVGLNPPNDVFVIWTHCEGVAAFIRWDDPMPDPTFYGIREDERKIESDGTLAEFFDYQF